MARRFVKPPQVNPILTSPSALGIGEIGAGIQRGLGQSGECRSALLAPASHPNCRIFKVLRSTAMC
jgi:hypothetical protein